MRGNKRAILIIISLLSIVLILSSCASKSALSEDSVQSNAVVGERDEFSEVSPEESDQAGTGSGIGNIEPEKVITSVFISLETTEFDSAIENLGSIVNKSKGYVENSHISSRGRINNKVFQHAQYTIRIPKNNMVPSPMKWFIKCGFPKHLKRRYSKQYYDTESRLNLLKG